jgi:hypothetical protein
VQDRPRQQFLGDDDDVGEDRVLWHAQFDASELDAERSTLELVPEIHGLHVRGVREPGPSDVELDDGSEGDD